MVRVQHRAVAILALSGCVWTTYAQPQEHHAAAPPAKAAADVDLTPKFKAGDRLELLWRRRSERHTPEGATITPDITQRATIEVLAPTAEGPVLAWTWGPLELEGVPRPAGEVDAGIALLENLRYELQLDSTWRIISVRDAEKLFAEVDRLGAIEDAKPLPVAVDEASAAVREAVRKSRELARTLRKNRTVVLGSFIKDPASYLAGIGWTLPPTETWRFTFETANAVDGAPITTYWDVGVSEFDPASATATILWEQRYDPAQFQAVVLKATRDLARKAGDKDFDTIQIDLEQHEEGMYVIDRATGWCVRGGWMLVRRQGKTVTKRVNLWEIVLPKGDAPLNQEARPER